MTDEYPKYYNNGTVRVDADDKVWFSNLEAAQEYFSRPIIKYYKNIMKDNEE